MGKQPRVGDAANGTLGEKRGEGGDSHQGNSMCLCSRCQRKDKLH